MEIGIVGGYDNTGRFIWSSLRAKAKSKGRLISFKFPIPKPLATVDGIDSKRYCRMLANDKVSGAEKGTSRCMPDSISILGPDDKPLPVKGFLLRDWPVGTLPTWKSLLLY